MGAKMFNIERDIYVLYPSEIKFPEYYEIYCWSCNTKNNIKREDFLEKEEVFCNACGEKLITPKFLKNVYKKNIEEEINPHYRTHIAMSKAMSALKLPELNKILKQFNINSETISKIRKIFAKKLTVRHIIYLMETNSFQDRFTNTEKYICNICKDKISLFNRYIFDYCCGKCYKKLKVEPLKIFFPDFYEEYVNKTTKHIITNNPNTREDIRKLKSTKLKQYRNSYENIVKIRLKLLERYGALNSKLVNSHDHKNIINELVTKYEIPKNELVNFDKILFETMVNNGYLFTDLNDIVEYIKKYNNKSVTMFCKKHKIKYKKYRPLSLENFYKLKVLNAKPEELFGCPICMKEISKGKSVEQNIFISELTNIIRDIIDSNYSLTFIPEKKFKEGNKTYSWDLYIPELNVAVEYDSIFWHSNLWARRYNLDERKEIYRLLRILTHKVNFERKNNIRVFRVFDFEYKDKNKRKLWQNYIIRYILKKMKLNKQLFNLFKFINCDNLDFELDKYTKQLELINFHNENNVTGSYLITNSEKFSINGYLDDELVLSIILTLKNENEIEINRLTVKRNYIIENIYTKCIKKIKKILYNSFGNYNNGIVKFLINGRLNNLKPVLPNYKIMLKSEPSLHLFENNKLFKANMKKIDEYINLKKSVVVTLSPWVGFFA